MYEKCESSGKSYRFAGRLRINRYQLAKIVQWIGKFRSRKRMQKLIFMLQAAGCPLDAEYDLHHYGPYSHDVARLTGELVAEKLLDETSELASLRRAVFLRPFRRRTRQLSRYEASPEGSGPASISRSFVRSRQNSMQDRPQGARGRVDHRLLPQEGADWSSAVEKTCQFKNLTAGTPFLEKCEVIAKEIVS